MNILVIQILMIILVVLFTLESIGGRTQELRIESEVMTCVVLILLLLTVL